MEQPYGGWLAAAKAASADNGLTDGVNGVTVAVTNPSGSTIKVVVTQAAPTYFMKAFNISSMNVNARATAALGPGSGCIFTLNQSGVDVGLSGTGNLTMPDCGVLLDSASAKALTFTGSPSISAKYIGIVGGYSDGSNNPNALTPTPVTGIAPASDPLAGKISPPIYDPSSCTSDPHPTSTVTIGPVAGGIVCYNGLSVSGSGNVTLRPGVYVINGAFSTSGSTSLSVQTTAACGCTDPGVTFYLTPPNGSVSLTGTGTLNLQAPCTGTSTCTSSYDGILFYQDPLDTNTMKIAGSSSAVVKGIVYAPGATLTLSGSAGSQFYMNMVVNALSISGNNALLNYSAVNSNTPLTMPRLTE